ncbi:UDP-N-acetylglucosamine 2-epimerase [Streptomyces sp. ALI-76-A]|nr:UDP-N-acetylglucosamine 2-epimerase [Streptomyces sp. ALI-76-A]MDL5206290.1 UDP-N-acetylglucosamine 2-epimerase [Streptomyces sp. ALI-76-A]
MSSRFLVAGPDITALASAGRRLSGADDLVGQENAAVKVLSGVGARPQIVQPAPIAWQLARRRDEHLIVRTGRHCHHLLSSSFGDEIGVPPPDVNLDTGSARQAEQTARTLAALDPVLARERRDWVLTYGDTNSLLAGTFAAAARELPIAHLSAGLRSFDRTMSAERNRIVADHLAGLLLAPTTVAMAALAAEGLTTRSLLVGDLTVDTLRMIRDQWAGSGEERHSPFLTGHPFAVPDRVSRALPARHRAPAGHHRRSAPAGRDGCRARRLPQALPAAGTPAARRQSPAVRHRPVRRLTAGGAPAALPERDRRAGCGRRADHRHRWPAEGGVGARGPVQHTARRDGGRRLFRTAGTVWCPTPEGCRWQWPGRGRPGGPATPFGDGENAVRIIDVLASRAHRIAQHAVRCGRAASAEVRT